MKVLGKILLTVLAIPVFILLILSINIRFQFLNSKYWIGAFEKGNVYQKISNKIRNSLEIGAIEGGGQASDVTDLSTLVSEENVKVFFEENTISFVDYANGNSDKVMVTFPFSNNILDLSQKMELTEFLSENNIEIFSGVDIKNISQFGKWSWIAMNVLLLLTLLIYLFLYLLTTPGKKLSPLGMSALLSGIFTLAVFAAGQFANSVIERDFVGNSNIGKSILAIVAVPVVREVSLVWLASGIFCAMNGLDSGP